MSALANERALAPAFVDLKSRLRVTWMSGDYDRFSRYMEKDAGRFFNRLGIKPGDRVLDVACGAGQIALIAARAGAVVTGCDIAANWLERARERAAAEGLPISFDDADAEALPYEDASFDAVVSLVGAMFAPRPDLVAAQLIRVCRPGGLIAMANWTAGGFIGRMFKIMGGYVPPPSMPSPLLWGDEPTVRTRLGHGVVGLWCTPRLYRFEYPFSPDEVVDFFRANYGPMSRAFETLDASDQQRLRGDLIAHWSDHNQTNHGATAVESEYLEVIAIRGMALQS